MRFLDVGRLQVAFLKLFSWLNSWSPVFILAPYERAIGNCSEEIYFGFLHARRTGRKIILIRPFQVFGLPDLCNRELFELQSPNSLRFGARFFRFGGCLALTLLFGHVPVTFQFFLINFRRTIRFLTAKARYRLRGSQGERPALRRQRRWHLYEPSQVGTDYVWNPLHLSEFSWKSANAVDWVKDFDNFLPVTFAEKKARQAEAVLREMGISEQDWFVCLHVREGGFKGDTKSFRNSDIMKCLPAIKAIVARGGKVVRIGDRSMRPLPPLPGVIDYPFTEHKSQLMDLYLIHKCRTYIGTNSGPMDVAHLFQKQAVYLNVTDWIISAQRSDALIIPKHMFSKKLNRYFSVQECLIEAENQKRFDLAHGDDEFSFDENTPEEILAVVLEGLDSRPSSRRSPLQEEYVFRRGEFIRSWMKAEFQPTVVSEDNEVLGRYRAEKLRIDGRYRVSSRALARGTVGREFLEKHWSASRFGEKNTN